MTEDQVIEIILPFLRRFKNWNKCYYIIRNSDITITDSILPARSNKFTFYLSDKLTYCEAITPGAISGYKDNFIELKQFNIKYMNIIVLEIESLT